MSVRGLTLLVLLQGALIAAVTYSGLDRLGYLRTAEPPRWKFVNQLLHVPYGTRVVVRSANPKAGRERFWFGPKIVEPEIDRDRAPTPADPPPLPYVALGRETQVGDEKEWGYVGVAYAVLTQLGARSLKEWLEEIRPVHERQPDGSRKLMLRAIFGHESGGRVIYYFDPADPDAAKRGFGWVRQELYGKEDLKDVTFALPAGRHLPPSKAGKPK